MIYRTLTFFAPAAVLSAWATVMLQLVVSGRIHAMLSPMFRNDVLAASLLLYALSVAYLVFHDPVSAVPESLMPRGKELGRWLLLLLPVVLAASFSSTTLSASTLQNRAPTSADAMPSLSGESAENVQAALSSDPNQPVPLEVTDLITISHTDAQIQAFNGRKVRVVGLYQPDGSKLVRWIMWCCAADAMPVSVTVNGQTAGAAAITNKESPWAEVVGTVTFPSTLGHIVPQIEADSVQPAKEPDEPYLSP